MNISQAGINLIKSFEGLRTKAYKAVPTEKYYTIGYGHYGFDVRDDDVISEKDAEKLLYDDVQSFVDAVNKLLKVDVTQNQFDALVSFAYNVGVGALKSSTLLEYLNAGNFQKAADEFLRWNKSGGKVYGGLVKRREQERALFLTGGSKNVSRGTSKPRTSTLKYKIKRGETLSGIAKKNKTTVSQLMKLNPSIKNANKIYAGQTIRLK